MRRLLTLAVVLVGLVVVYVVVDLLAKGVVEGRVEDEFRDGRLDAEAVSFTVDSFPFLAPLALSGEVSATLRVEGIQERGVRIDTFDLEVDGLVFDRASAFSGEVEVTGLDRATTSISLGEGTIGDLVGVPVDVAADGTVTAGEVTVQATLEGGELVLAGEGIGRTAVPVRLSRFLPCEPEVAVVESSVTLTCVTEELPPIVDRVLGELNRRG